MPSAGAPLGDTRPGGSPSLRQADHESRITNHDEDPSWRAAREYGCDMSIIDANLRKTPEERIIAHEMALDLARALREAGRRYYAEHD